MVARRASFRRYADIHVDVQCAFALQCTRPKSAVQEAHHLLLPQRTQLPTLSHPRAVRAAQSRETRMRYAPRHLHLPPPHRSRLAVQSLLCCTGCLPLPMMPRRESDAHVRRQALPELGLPEAAPLPKPPGWSVPTRTTARRTNPHVLVACLTWLWRTIDVITGYHVPTTAACSVHVCTHSNRIPWLHRGVQRAFVRFHRELPLALPPFPVRGLWRGCDW